MANNEPLLVEDRIMNSINNHKLNEIPMNLRYTLQSIYYFVGDNETVLCKKPDSFIKPDLIIKVDNEIRYVSIKTGRAEVVHNEIIDNFVKYLKEEGISQETIDTIKLFHYGDGTTDGSGKTRKCYIEVMSELKDKIKMANKELNYRKAFVLKTMRRCVFQGVDDSNPSIDAIYFGDERFGIVTTTKQIVAHIKKRSFDYIDNLHIGPLLLRPHSRYVGRQVADERNRERIVAYWPKLSADLEYISKRYDY